MSNKTIALIFSFYVSCVYYGNAQATSPTPYCGPVACYVTLQYFDIDCTLEKASALCGYDDKPVKLLDVHNALASFQDIECSVGKCDSRRIKKYLSVPNTVLLLVQESGGDEETDHLVVLFSKDGEYVWIDYPKIIANYDIEDLPGNLAAKCMIVRKSVGSYFSSIAIYPFLAISGVLFFLLRKVLRKRNDIVVIMLGILVMSSICYGDGVRSNPKTVIDFDLGLIESTEPNVVKEVSIKNELMSPLLIEEVMVSCSSCIKPLSWANKIEPQKAGLFKFEVITKGRKGQVSPRAVIKGDIASYMIKFKGYIRSLWPEVEAIELGNVKSGESVLRKIKLFQAGYPDAKIEKIEYSNDSSMCQSKEKEKPNDTKEGGCFELLNMTFDFSNTKLGVFDESVTIATNIEKYSKIVIPVNAYVVGDVTLYPSKIIFINSNSSDENIVRNLKAILYQPNGSQYDLKELKFVSDNPNLDIKPLDYDGKKGILNIEMTLSRNSKMPKSFNGEVVVCNQEKELFKIPYLVISTH